jgi:hypothetical protein
VFEPTTGLYPVMRVHRTGLSSVLFGRTEPTPWLWKMRRRRMAFRICLNNRPPSIPSSVAIESVLFGRNRADATALEGEEEDGF